MCADTATSSILTLGNLIVVKMVTKVVTGCNNMHDTFSALQIPMRRLLQNATAQIILLMKKLKTLRFFVLLYGTFKSLVG